MTTIPQETFLTAIQAAAAVANARSTSMIGQCIRISATDDTMTIQATDMDHWIALDLPCEGALEPVTVNAAKVVELVARMRAGPLKLDASESALTLSAKGGGKRKLMLVTIPFPDTPAVSGEPVTFEIARLREAIEFVGPSMADDMETKAQFCGVHIHSAEGRLRAAAYNGVGMASIDIAEGRADPVTVGRRTIDLTKHLPKVGQVELTVSERMLSLRWNTGMIVGTRIEGKFPSYLDKMPEHSAELAVRADEMVKAIRAVAVIGSDETASKSKRLKMRLEDRKIEYEGEDGNAVSYTAGASMIAESQEGYAEQPVESAWSGEKMDIGFASRRMEQALSGFGDDEMRIGIGSPIEAMVFRSVVRDDRMALLMPVRL